MKYLMPVIFFSFTGFSQVADTTLILDHIDEAKILSATDHEQAKKVATEACVNSKEIGFLRGEALSYFVLGTLDFYDLKYNEAIDLYKKSLAILTRLSDIDSLHIFDCNFNIAVCYQADNQYVESGNYILEALKYADVLAENSIWCYAHLGDLQMGLGNYKESIEYSKIALSEAKKINASSLLVDQCTRLIDCYLATLEFFKAEEQIDFVKPYLVTDSIDSYSKLDLYRAFSNFYIETDSFEQALFYAKAIENHTTPYENFDLWALILNGKIYYELENYSQAEQYLLQALKSSKAINDLEIESNSCLYLSKLYSQKKNFQDAFFYSERYRELREIIEKAKDKKIVANLLLAYENEKKDKALIEQELTILNQEQTNKYQNIVLGLFLFFLCVSIFYLYRLRKNHDLVKRQKKEVSMALESSQLLRRELHHRVKNNLQLISSYWDLQAKKIEDTFTLNVVEEGQNHIYAISLVHQLLYKRGEETIVNMEKYVSTLLQKISVSNTLGKIDLNIQIKEIQFNMDQAISIGLILNELFTNTKKHAFDGKENGLVTISISKGERQKYNLKYSDNGSGLLTDFKTITGSSDSLGLKIIEFLSEELNGKYKMYNDNGANFELVFN